MKQRILLIFILLLALLPHGKALAFEYKYEGQTLYYTVVDEETKTCKVSGNKNITGYVIIPSTVKNAYKEYSVSFIGDGAFRNCRELTSVDIPNSVTSIGDEVFYNCRILTSVVLPNSVTDIGEMAFYGCSGLTSITIPNSVTSIGKSAFEGCSGLTYITIPNSITSIE